MGFWILFGLGVALLVIAFIWFVFVKGNGEMSRILILGMDALLILTSVLVVSIVLYMRNVKVSQDILERDRLERENIEQNMGEPSGFTDVQEETQEMGIQQQPESLELPQQFDSIIPEDSKAPQPWEGDGKQSDIVEESSIQEGSTQETDIQENDIQETSAQEDNTQESGTQESLSQESNIQEDSAEQDSTKETYIE